MIELRKVGSYMRRDYSSNGARSMGILPMRTGRMPVPRIRCPRGSHTQFVLGTDCGFVIEGKAHGHESTDRGCPLVRKSKQKFQSRIPKNCDNTLYQLLL